jgi:hypothetical protein
MGCFVPEHLSHNDSNAAMHATDLQESAQLQQVAAWRRVQDLKAAHAKAQKAKAALAQGTQSQLAVLHHNVVECKLMHTSAVSAGNVLNHTARQVEHSMYQSIAKD